MNPLLPSVIAGISALVGALIGAMVNPLLTFRLNERQRRMEMYKTVYPDKVKAAREVMEAARHLYDLTWRHCVLVVEAGGSDEDEENQLYNEANALSYKANALEWMLGTPVANAATTFAKVCKGALSDADMRREEERLAESLGEWQEEEGSEGTISDSMKRSSVEALHAMTGRLTQKPEIPEYVAAYRKLIHEMRRVLHFNEFDNLYHEGPEVRS